MQKMPMERHNRSNATKNRGLHVSVRTGCVEHNDEEKELGLSSTSRVPMVQTANLRDGNDLALGRRFHVAWRRRVAIQGQVTAGVVVVVEVLGQDAMQMAFVQNDDMIQTVAADAADGALAIWILPGRVRCGQDFFYAHAFHACS